jgi:hypothetical protein
MPSSLLITTSPPPSLHLLGLRAKEEFGINWMADWRDIWGSVPPVSSGRDFELQAENYTRSVLDRADLVTATSHFTVERFRSLSEKPDYHFLPNGYRESDFSRSVPEASNSIGVYGTYSRLLKLDLMFQWLADYHRLRPETEFRIVHVGIDEGRTLRKLARRLDLAGLLDSRGYLSHSEAVRTMRSHRLNLLTLSDEFDTSFIIPSRLFELLRAEPPLVLWLPKISSARCILERHNFADVDIVDRPEEFKLLLDRYLNEGSERHRRSRAGVERFERSRQLSELEKILSRVM